MDRMVEDPGDLLPLIVNLGAADIPTLQAMLQSANLSAYADLMAVSRRRMLDIFLGLGLAFGSAWTDRRPQRRSGYQPGIR